MKNYDVTNKEDVIELTEVKTKHTFRNVLIGVSGLIITLSVAFCMYTIHMYKQLIEFTNSYVSTYEALLDDVVETSEIDPDIVDKTRNEYALEFYEDVDAMKAIVEIDNFNKIIGY